MHAICHTQSSWFVEQAAPCPTLQIIYAVSSCMFALSRCDLTIGLGSARKIARNLPLYCSA